MEGFQLIPFDLGTKAWVAGQPLQFDFLPLQGMYGMGIAHTVFLDFELQISPTYTTAPTIVGLNNAISDLQIYDGERNWTPTGWGFNAQRTAERLENGRIILPDPVTNGASTGLRVVRRRFAWGPQNMIGNPSDSAMPNFGLNQGGYARATCGQLTSISGDTTAATGTLKCTAMQALSYSKLIFPSWYERLVQPVATGTQFQQEALYAMFAFINSTSYDAFALGDIGAVSFSTQLMQPMTSIDAAVLTAGHNADFQVGQFDGLNGDPRSVTLDINGRTMNGATPTALTNVPLDVQAGFWPQKGCRLTKLAYYAPSVLTVNFTGANVGTQAVMGRYRPLGAIERGVSLARVLAKLTGRQSLKFNYRLEDDTEAYNGPLAKFLPWQSRLNGLPY